MRVPGFLVRQFYVAGSLRSDDGGFTFQARNPLGEGMLVGVGRITVDGVAIDPASVTASRAGDPTVLRASEVSPAAPVAFRRGDVVTFRVSGRPLSPGLHRFEVEIDERDLGRLTLSVSDRPR